MPSADLFLRLLEEKDLVSAAVLQAARREVQQSSPPPDAVRISLWLVQGQHITAAQADRLLSAAAEKTEAPGQSRRRQDRLAAEAARPKQALRQATFRMNWNLPRWRKKGKQRAKPKPAKPSARAARTPLRQALGRTASGQISPVPAEDPMRQALRPVAQAESQDKKSPAAAKIGDELESLEDDDEGPLDALIESEALQANRRLTTRWTGRNSIRPFPRSSSSAAS